MCKKSYVTNRSRDYYRNQRQRSIKRKYDIRVHQWGKEEAFDLVRSQPRNYGLLNKGKVHCGCWMCSEKTKARGYKKQDQAKIEAMLKDIKDFDFE